MHNQNRAKLRQQYREQSLSIFRKIQNWKLDVCVAVAMAVVGWGSLPAIGDISSKAVIRYTQDAGINTDISSRKEAYQKALKQLNSIAPKLNAETRAGLPAIKEILRRWAEGEALGGIEEQVVDAFGLGGRGGTPLPSIDSLRSKLNAANHDINSQAAKFQFIAASNSIGGKARGIVSLRGDKRDTVIVVVLSEAGKATPAGRAQIIAGRMKELSNSMPNWWAQMVVSQTGGKDPLYYVATKQHPTSPIITADAGFAREAGCEPPALAKQLITTMRNTIVDSARAFDDPQTPEEKHWVAFLNMQEADKALQKGDEARAENFYKQSIELDPNYVMPYLRLIDLYLSGKTKKDKQAALTQLDAIKKLPKLKAEDRKDISKFEARLK